MMPLRALRVLTCLTMVMAATSRPAAAAPITYDVIDLIAAGGASISGTITTDGTIGTLSVGNIVDWDLTLTDPFDTAQVVAGTNGSQVHLDGNALTATLTQLLFNFSAGDGSDFHFEDWAAGMFDGEVCWTSDSNCWGPPGVGVYNVGNDDGSFYTMYSGVQVIAEAEAAPVPEPASMLLLGSGLVGAAVRRYRARHDLAGPPQMD